MPTISCAKRTLIVSLVMGALAFVAAAALIGILFSSYVKKRSDSSEDDLRSCYANRKITTEGECPIISAISSDDDMSIPGEALIAKGRHLLGAAPLHYNWTVNFLDSENFTGKVNIVLKIIESTKRIAVHSDSLTLDVGGIRLRSCSGEVICVEKITLLKSSQMVILDLKRFLKPKHLYVLQFNNFEGSVSNEDGGSAGLRLSNKNSPNWAITTIFQMRLARTVFPCFDHPSLKATFTICVEHSSDTEAYSNTNVNSRLQFNDTDRMLECYHPTPKIPTYVATISLLGNFSKRDDESFQPKIELFFSSSDTFDNFKWELAQTRDLLEIFENMFGLKYNLSKLGLINVNPSPFWGVENFGLVTLESGFTRFSETERGRTILIHEIIHQWLGDVATISYWDEICLQEGLTAYLEMLLSERLKVTSAPVTRQIRGLISEYFSKDHSYPLIQRYNVTQDIADFCFGKPVVFIHSIAYGYGSELWILFLKRLVEKFKYSNANLDDWVSLLEEVSGSVEPGDVLKSWFTSTGYPIIFAVQSVGQIKLEQKLFFNEGSPNKTKPFVPQYPRLIPLRIFLSKWNKSTPVVLMNAVTQSIELESSDANEYILVDPDAATFSRKLYSVDNYLSIIDCFFETGKNDCQLLDEQVQDTFSDFCFGILEEEIPRDIESTESNAIGKWESIVAKLRNLTSNAFGRKQLIINRVCECCLRSKEELMTEKFAHWHPNSCKGVWNDKCRSLPLMKLIGRDYVLPEH